MRVFVGGSAEVSVLLLWAVLGGVLCAPNWFGSVCLAGFYPCTAYCMYSIDSGHNLLPECVAGRLANGGCLACDTLLFTMEPGGFCVPHLFSSES